MVPDLEGQIHNMGAVIDQLSETILKKKKEIIALEQQYESLMKQSQNRKDQDAIGSAAAKEAGGVLV